MPVSVLFLITSFSYGGAETMLHRLLGRIDRSRFTPQVVSVVDFSFGPLLQKFQSLGIPFGPWECIQGGQTLSHCFGLSNGYERIRLI